MVKHENVEAKYRTVLYSGYTPKRDDIWRPGEPPTPYEHTAIQHHFLTERLQSLLTSTLNAHEDIQQAEDSGRDGETFCC
jgi:hypothetical protein